MLDPCSLEASQQALSASDHSQRRLQQQLAACKDELQDTAARADAAHSEALSYLSKLRQQDKQAELDRYAINTCPSTYCVLQRKAYS